MSSKQPWLYSKSANKLLGIACVVTTLSGLLQLLASGSSTTRIVEVGAMSSDAWFWTFFAAVIVALVAQLLLMLAMIIYVVRRSDWGGLRRTVFVIAQFVTFLSAATYVFSYRPSVLARTIDAD